MLIEKINIEISREGNMLIAIVKYNYDGTKHLEQATQGLTLSEVYENVYDLMKIKIREINKRRTKTK